MEGALWEQPGLYSVEFFYSGDTGMCQFAQQGCVTTICEAVAIMGALLSLDSYLSTHDLNFFSSIPCPTS